MFQRHRYVTLALPTSSLQTAKDKTASVSSVKSKEGKMNAEKYRSKTMRFSVFAILSILSLLPASKITQASSTHLQALSGKQKVTWSVGGDCVDLYDEYQTEYLIYEGEDCYFSVKVVPSLPLRTVAIQVKDENVRWYTERQTKTNKQGVAILRPDTTDSEGYFLCDYFDYRLGVARLGNAKAVLSETFSIEFTADDEYCY